MILLSNDFYTEVYMNSSHIKKSILNFSLCLITVLTLTSCSSNSTRDVASEEGPRYDHTSDVSKVEDGTYPPHKVHGKRSEYSNQTH